MTKICFRVGVCVVALLVCVLPQVAQSVGPNEQAAQPPQAPGHAQFFAGTVVELDGSHIRVTRTLVGRPTESRSFAINGSTKINRVVIKMKIRVTVRYKRMPDGDVALEIQPKPVIASTTKV